MHEQLRACTSIRRMLSANHGPPIDAVIEAGLLPPLVSKLALPKLQLEAAWALTNVASGSCDQTAAVVAAGALEPFIALLDSDNHEVVGQERLPEQTETESRELAENRHLFFPVRKLGMLPDFCFVRQLLRRRFGD